MVQAAETAAGRSVAVRLVAPSSNAASRNWSSGQDLGSPRELPYRHERSGRGRSAGRNGSTLMAILPAGATFTAELEVPTASAGFLEVGQEVQL